MELSKLEKYYNEFEESIEKDNYDSEEIHMQIDELNLMFIEFCDDYPNSSKYISEYAHWLYLINKIEYIKWYA